MSDKDPKAPPDPLEEERRRLQRAAEAELRDIERTKARAEVHRLWREYDAARKAGDLARAAALKKKREQLVLEIRERFGY